MENGWCCFIHERCTTLEQRGFLTCRGKDPTSHLSTHITQSLNTPPHPAANAQNPSIPYTLIDRPFPERLAAQFALVSRFVHFESRPGDHGCVVGTQGGGRAGELDLGVRAGGEEGVEAGEGLDWSSGGGSLGKGNRDGIHGFEESVGSDAAAYD